MAGLYIHVPFCKKRCVYCDFFSHTQIRYKDQYLSAVVKEMAMRKDYIAGEPLETVYLGGGTPSLLSAADLERVFDAIYRLFPVKENAEITLEANPEDMTPGYVASLRSLPFNRVSMGVQSFNDEDLRFLRRRHTACRAIEAVRLCEESGYGNISIDLMYGLPGQTLAKWKENVKEALRLNIAHLSAYHLTFEKDTLIYRMKDEGRIRPLDEEASLSLFTALTDMLTDAGYLHYEISNFAKPGRISLHNSSYWMGKKYLGIGPSAHSYNVESRQWNVSSLQRYMEGIQKGLPYVETEMLNINDKYNEYILTRLRTQWGISLSRIQADFGESKYLYCKMQAERWVGSGILRIEDDKLVFSKNGWFVSDSVISALLWVDSYTKPGI
jgi:oxygen-independent coproporphyrinogen-3 oxidase